VRRIRLIHRLFSLGWNATASPIGRTRRGLHQVQNAASVPDGQRRHGRRTVTAAGEAPPAGWLRQSVTRRRRKRCAAAPSVRHGRSLQRTRAADIATVNRRSTPLLRLNSA
jgi:hypothetical protein